MSETSIEINVSLRRKKKEWKCKTTTSALVWWWEALYVYIASEKLQMLHAKLTLAKYSVTLISHSATRRSTDCREIRVIFVKCKILKLLERVNLTMKTICTSFLGQSVRHILVYVNEVIFLSRMNVAVVSLLLQFCLLLSPSVGLEHVQRGAHSTAHAVIRCYRQKEESNLNNCW